MSAVGRLVHGGHMSVASLGSCAHGPGVQGAGKGFLVGVGYDMVMVGQYNHIMSGLGSCGALVSLVWLLKHKNIKK